MTDNPPDPSSASAYNQPADRRMRPASVRHCLAISLLLLYLSPCTAEHNAHDQGSSASCADDSDVGNVLVAKGDGTIRLPMPCSPIPTVHVHTRTCTRAHPTLTVTRSPWPLPGCSNACQGTGTMAHHHDPAARDAHYKGNVASCWHQPRSPATPWLRSDHMTDLPGPRKGRGAPRLFLFTVHHAPCTARRPLRAPHRTDCARPSTSWTSTTQRACSTSAGEFQRVPLTSRRRPWPAHEPHHEPPRDTPRKTPRDTPRDTTSHAMRHTTSHRVHARAYFPAT